MTGTQPLHWNQIHSVIATALVLIASSSVFGQFYLQGGASNWFDFEPPSSIISELPFLDEDSSSVDGNVQFWLGAGYQVNEEWSFEAFYSELPSTEVNTEFYIFFRDLYSFIPK